MKLVEKKANRLLQIETLLLQHPEGLTQSELARRLGVNRSTILRNLPDLQAPIYEQDGRYFLNRQGDLINVRFNLHEALSIHLAARLLASTMDRQNPHAAASLRKLGLALEPLAPIISKHLSASADKIDEEAQKQDQNYLSALENLTQAWAESRKVKILYHKDEDSRDQEYLFSPYYIEPSSVGRSTYVFGLREPPGELRTFKIERIQRIELLQEPYQIPPHFNPTELLSHAWNIWYTDEEPVEVILKFQPRVARRVGETRWHRSEQVTRQEDGCLLWRAWIAEPKEMMPWIRGWGADVEVLQPVYLRKLLSEEARKMCEVYK